MGRTALKATKAARRAAQKALSTGATGADRLAKAIRQRRAALAAANQKPGARRVGAGANSPCHQTKPRATKPTVKRGADAPKGPQPVGKATKPPIIDPPKIQARKENTMPAGNTGNSANRAQQGTSAMWHAARAFWTTCANYRTRGNLEIRNEAYEMAATLALIADAITVRSKANARENLDPSLHQLYARIADSVQAAATASRLLGPGFDAMHKQLVDNLLKGVNPGGWDSTNNGR